MRRRDAEGSESRHRSRVTLQLCRSRESDIGGNFSGRKDCPDVYIVVGSACCEQGG